MKGVQKNLVKRNKLFKSLMDHHLLDSLSVNAKQRCLRTRGAAREEALRKPRPCHVAGEGCAFMKAGCARRGGV